MRKTLLISALLSALVAFPVASFAQSGDAAKPAQASSKGKSLYPQPIYDYYLKQRLAQGAPDSPELQSAIRDELNTRELLLREAKKANTEKKENVKTEMDLASQMVLVRAYLNDWIAKNPISDDVLRQEYEALKTQVGDKEYNVSHILVEKEDEAKDIIKTLQGGKKKFADIAKEKSKDPGSKEKGGSLGWNAPSNFVKPFGEALGSIQKGKYTTTPVKSDYGYHVILIEDVREMKLPSFDELKPQLQQRAQAQWLERYFKQLREKAGV